MKNLYLVPILAMTLFAGAAKAAPIEVDIPNNIEAPASTLTRAEVIADLYVWRLAGLQEFYRSELSPDTGSDQYKSAAATYQVLRASPQFADLVHKLQENPGEAVLARRTLVALAQSSK